MEKEFINYTEALALKELGFDEPCLVGYSTSTKKLEFYSRPLITKDSFTVDTPTYSQAFRWFREKYNIQLGICHIHGGFDCWTNDGDLFENGKYCNFKTYEEAELECLKKLISIVKEK